MSIAELETEFDEQYYCAECYTERGELIKFTYLPNPTIWNDLVVKVCKICDGKELIRLAFKNREDDWDA